MRKNISIAIILAAVLAFTSCASRQKAVIPETTPESDFIEVDETARELKKQPLTKAQGRKAMRKREKASKETYEKHHDNLQTKEVRKRMKKNKKKSGMSNKSKKPGALKKLFM